MLLSYDTQADAKYLILQPKKQKKGVVARTKQLEDWLLVDYDKDGKIFGIEILFASHHPISLSIVGNREVYYSSDSVNDLLEGDVVLVDGEAVPHDIFS